MRRSAFILLAAVGLLTIAGMSLIFFTSVQKTENLNPSGDAEGLRALSLLWEQRIEKDTAEKAYAAFKEEAPLSKEFSEHSQAHAFGEALYAAEGLPGLKVCDSTFDFGCYHSFFGVAVSKEGIEALPQLSASCSEKYAENDKNLPCQHGIGHGLLVYTDYENVLDALELCETITESLMGGCTSGVFMEYNFHTMDESNVEGYFREKSDDLYAPCNTLPSRFQPSCYFEQVQWWQAIFHNDFAHIGALCGELEGNSENFLACYNGIGNYVAAYAHNDITKIRELCSLMETEEKTARCHEGASWLVRSADGMEEKVEELCEVLAEPYKSECFLKLH